MIVKDLVAELLRLPNQNQQVKLMGNLSNGDDKDFDVHFNSILVWGEDEKSCTLMLCNK